MRTLRLQRAAYPLCGAQLIHCGEQLIHCCVSERLVERREPTRVSLPGSPPGGPALGRTGISALGPRTGSSALGRTGSSGRMGSSGPSWPARDSCDLRLPLREGGRDPRLPSREGGRDPRLRSREWRLI